MQVKSIAECSKDTEFCNIKKDKKKKNNQKRSKQSFFSKILLNYEPV